MWSGPPFPSVPLGEVIPDGRFPGLITCRLVSINIHCTYPALHFPQTAFFVSVQGLIVCSLMSQMVHGLHEERSCLSEYVSPSLHCTHCTVALIPATDPHCGTKPWPSGHSGQFKHIAALPGLPRAIWFHLHFRRYVSCAENWWLYWVRILNLVHFLHVLLSLYYMQGLELNKDNKLF